MNFRDLLLRAKAFDTEAIAAIITMYKPLLVKESIIGGLFDEDLFQELVATLLNCIQKINNF